MANRFAGLEVHQVVERPEIGCNSEDQKQIVENSDNKYKNANNKKKFMFRLINENGECKIAKTEGYEQHLRDTGNLEKIIEIANNQNNNDLTVDLMTAKQEGTEAEVKEVITNLLGSEDLPNFKLDNTIVPDIPEVQKEMETLVNDINTILQGSNNWETKFGQSVAKIMEHFEKTSLHETRGGASLIARARNAVSGATESAQNKFYELTAYLNNNVGIIKSLGVVGSAGTLAHQMGQLGNLISLLMQILSFASKALISVFSDLQVTTAITNVTTLRTREAIVKALQTALDAGIKKPEMLTTLSIYGSYLSIILQLFGTYRLCQKLPVANCTIKVMSTRVILEVTLGTLSLLPGSFGSLGTIAATAGATMTGAAALASIGASIVYMYTKFTSKTDNKIKDIVKVNNEANTSVNSPVPEDEGFASLTGTPTKEIKGGSQRKRSHRRRNSNRRQNKRSHRRQNKRSNRKRSNRK